MGNAGPYLLPSLHHLLSWVARSAVWRVVWHLPLSFSLFFVGLCLLVAVFRRQRTRV